MKHPIRLFFSPFRWIKRLLKNLWEEIVILRHFYCYEIRPCSMRKYAYLRACCHVMDKGLESDNWEPGHGLMLYKTAVKLRAELAEIYNKDNAFSWVDNVMSEYKKAQLERNQGTERMFQSNDFSFSKEELLVFEKIINTRTSCRNYKDIRINPKILESLVKSAIEAPVGCCRQTVRFFITQNEEKISLISKEISGMTCFSKIPCLAIVYVHSASYMMEDRKLQYIDASLAVENFVLAATAHNLGTTICNFTSSSKKERKVVSKVLDIDDQYSPVVVISLGYPSRIPRKPLRMNLSEFYKYCE